MRCAQAWITRLPTWRPICFTVCFKQFPLSNSAPHLTETLCLQQSLKRILFASTYIYLWFPYFCWYFLIQLTSLKKLHSFFLLYPLKPCAITNNSYYITLEGKLWTKQTLSCLMFFIYRPNFNIQLPKHNYLSSLTSCLQVYLNFCCVSWGSNVIHPSKSNLDLNTPDRWEHRLLCHKALPQSLNCHMNWRTAQTCWNALFKTFTWPPVNTNQRTSQQEFCLQM